MSCSKNWAAAVLVTFWTVWFALVLASNITDLAQSLGWLPSGWRFVSGNYALLQRTTAIYSLPPWANRALFVGVIAWEAVATCLLAGALAALCTGRLTPARTELAFAVAAGLFAAFALADELFLAFAGGLEATHLRVLVALLVSLLVLRSGSGAASVAIVRGNAQRTTDDGRAQSHC